MYNDSIETDLMEHEMKGWGAQDDFQEQIQQTIADAQAEVAARMAGPGKKICEDCEEPIPELRRIAYPSCTRCVGCQEEAESGFYRRPRYESLK